MIDRHVGAASTPRFLCRRKNHGIAAWLQEQKIDPLRRWAYDASELAVAEEEGMSGNEPSRLSRILAVLHALTEGYDVEHSPSTKQKGV
ncbi:MAG TPA: hypothetical protein VMV78_05065 [Thiobacillus sp.]|jgi:hypothetical protein|nr:hypothetical protein [Thiobacillus sp.]